MTSRRIDVRHLLGEIGAAREKALGATDTDRSARRAETLPLALKLGFPLGDHTINISLAATSLFYLYFLTEIAGLRPALAGMVLLVGRAVDAFTDPAMGRLSDLTRWRSGRRRPYFLLGALPFGISFALLWQELPLASQEARFALYAAAYVLHALGSTVLAVPYMALLPEMVLGYQGRTVLNVFRTGGAMLGVLLAAVAIPRLVAAFGDGAGGYAGAGLVIGVWVAVPWAIVYWVTWERPELVRPAHTSLVEGVKSLARHATYRRLVLVYLSARIGLDIVGAMLIFYMTYWLARAEDFSLAIALLLLGSIAALPLWLLLSRRLDKHTIFIAAAVWWIAVQMVLFTLQPGWPVWAIFAIAAAAGVGYVGADVMPWSMLGDVVDEDELSSGERREGIYAGTFTFLRKLGGASAVALAGFVLDLAGFRQGEPQADDTLLAIRALTALGPAFFLAVAAAAAWSYPLTRERHAAILRDLGSRSDARRMA